MPSIRMLLLEDSALDAELIEARLARDGIDFTIDRVETREAFVEALGAGGYDLILADYALPSFDGLSALRIAHESRPEIPFLFVSGGLGEEVAIESLKRGATDYVLKHRLDRLAPSVRRAIAEASERAERHRAEQALREGEQRLRMALDAGRLGDWRLDLATGLLDASERCKANFGLPPDARISHSRLFEIVHPDDRDRVRGQVQEAIADRSVFEAEYRNIWPDGSVHWVLARGVGIYGEDGEVRGMVGVTLDITERKRSEEALIEADRRKDEFLAMLAHELRNPLSAISNAVLLARRPGMPTEHQEWANGVIAAQVGHLTRLIDDLLDVSRITRGKIQLRKEPTDLAPIVDRAVAVVRSLVESRKHELTVQVGSGALTVEGDRTRLEQVLTNLLTNAAKFTEEGGRLRISAAREDDEVVVRVCDTGVGISPEMIASIFEPFTQLERTIHRSQGGLGIGLTLSRKLIELHGGRIEARSDGPGCGSEFTVRLPLAESARADEAEAPDRDGSAGARGRRVLIVDDNIVSAEGLSRLLEYSGYRVETVHDGPAGLEAARRFRPEVILLDIGLPILDGYQVARRLREGDDGDGALIVAISGYGQEIDRLRSREAGFDHHLVKPLDLDRLLQILAGEEPEFSPSDLDSDGWSSGAALDLGA